MKRQRLLSRSVMIIIVALLFATVPVFASSTAKTLSTNYTVVNLSTVNDASVTALYYKDDGTAWTGSDFSSFPVLKNYGQFTARQYSDNGLSSGKGSVVLSSSEPLAAVVQIQARGQVSTLGAYSGYTSGSNKFYVPLVMRYAGSANGTANTQIMIQNIMNEDITATVKFIPQPGTAYSTFTKTFDGSNNIKKYSTKYYDVADESASNLPNGWTVCPMHRCAGWSRRASNVRSAA